MAEIDNKIEKIKKNCIETAKKETSLLKQNNDSVCNQEVEKMINDYKGELAQKYSSDLNKIEREYNKELFNLEMQERVKINNLKKQIEKDVKSEVRKEFEKYITSKEYENYLFKNIENTLKKIPNLENTVIYVTEKDYKKYGKKIETKFKLKIETIDNDNIGGAIVVDNVSKISIDNTIKNSIEEVTQRVLNDKKA